MQPQLLKQQVKEFLDEAQACPPGMYPVGTKLQLTAGNENLIVRVTDYIRHLTYTNYVVEVVKHDGHKGLQLSDINPDHLKPLPTRINTRRIQDESLSEHTDELFKMPEGFGFVRMGKVLEGDYLWVGTHRGPKADWVGFWDKPGSNELGKDVTKFVVVIRPIPKPVTAPPQPVVTEDIEYSSTHNLTEASKGCLLVRIPSVSDCANVTGWVHDNIKEKDLADSGYENDIHVTVLYGFDDSVKSEEVDKVIKANFPKGVKLRLGPMSFFDTNDEYDVLKCDVESEDLHALNKALNDEFGKRIENSFPDYHPHMTLAYVKKGACKDLKGNAQFAGWTINCPQFIYSASQMSANAILPIETEDDLDEGKEPFRSKIFKKGDVIIASEPDAEISCNGTFRKVLPDEQFVFDVAPAPGYQIHMRSKSDGKYWMGSASDFSHPIQRKYTPRIQDESLDDLHIFTKGTRVKHNQPNPNFARDGEIWVITGPGYSGRTVSVNFENSPSKEDWYAHKSSLIVLPTRRTTTSVADESFNEVKIVQHLTEAAMDEGLLFEFLNYNQLVAATHDFWRSRFDNAKQVDIPQPDIVVLRDGDMDLTFGCRARSPGSGRLHYCGVRFFPDQTQKKLTVQRLKEWWGSLRARLNKFLGRKVPEKILTGSDLRAMKCKVTCDCEDYKYRLEVANKAKGSSDIKHSNGARPNIRNPDMHPGMCKHLLSLLRYLTDDASIQAKEAPKPSTK